MRRLTSLVADASCGLRLSPFCVSRLGKLQHPDWRNRAIVTIGPPSDLNSSLSSTQECEPIKPTMVTTSASV